MARENEQLKKLTQNMTPEHERSFEQMTREAVLGSVEEIEAINCFNPEETEFVTSEREVFAACMDVIADEDAPARHARIATHRAVSAAFSLGLMCGVRGPETAIEVAKAMRARGGRRSGEVRSQIAQTTWRPHALELAIQIRDEYRDFSQPDLASEIRERWKLEKPKAPSLGTLIKFIREMEDAGKLPPGPRKRQRTSSRS